MNPVLGEHFSLRISNDDLTCLLTAMEPLLTAFCGEGGFCTLPGNEFHSLCMRTDPGDGQPGSGSSNSTSPFFIVDETEASVVQMGERFVLLYHQQSDASHFLENGIALALNNFQ